MEARHVEMMWPWAVQAVEKLEKEGPGQGRPVGAETRRETREACDLWRVEVGVGRRRLGRAWAGVKPLCLGGGCGEEGMKESGRLEAGM